MAVPNGSRLHVEDLAELLEGGDVLRNIVAIHELIGVFVEKGNCLIPKHDRDIVLAREDPQGDPEGFVRAVSGFGIGEDQDEDRSVHGLS